MRSARRVFVVLAVSLAGIALPPNPLGAQPSPRGASGQWLPPENGQMPRNAVVLRAVDGAPEYICQAVIAGGPALGIASGGVCRIGRRESREFSVLVADVRLGTRPTSATAEPFANAGLRAADSPLSVGSRASVSEVGASGSPGLSSAARASIEGVSIATAGSVAAASTNVTGNGLPGVSPECTNEVRSQPAAGAVELRPGISEASGQPYIDAVLADGTVRRVTRAGVTIIRPNGASVDCFNQVVRMDTQPPTPPVLPSDPSLGRRWLERHSEAVLDVIRAMTDDDVVAALLAAEPQIAGDDVFRQITYRTGIASFYADRLP